MGAPIVTGTNATTRTITGLTNGTPVTYTVAAHNAVGVGAPSAPVTVTPAIPAQAPPTNVLASAGNASATVTWTAAAGATSYAVTSTPAGGVASISGTTATVTGLTNGTSYTFSVTATGPGGTSAPAVSPAVTPTATFITQHIVVSRPQGALIIGEACSAVPLGTYPQDCTVNLGTAALNATGTYYVATGAFDEVTVLDTRDTNPGWTVNVQSTPFTGVNPPTPSTPATSATAHLPPTPLPTWPPTCRS